MSSEYVNKEVDSILSDKEFEFPQNIAMACAWILGNLKGVNLRVLDVKGMSSLTDFFIIGSAQNATQAKSMAQEISFQLRRNNIECISQEGADGGEWILLDFGDVIVHVFQELSRDYFAIEEVWKDAKMVKIPNDYYIAEDEAQNQEEDKERSYF
jgi:ribosome-associated protein